MMVSGRLRVPQKSISGPYGVLSLIAMASLRTTPPSFAVKRRKHEALQYELAAVPASSPKRRKVQGNPLAKHPLPPQTVFRLKRLYQADSVQAQHLLEERLAKRARVGNTTKRQRLA